MINEEPEGQIIFFYQSSAPFRLYSPPLVVRVDVPDDALREDLVLVHGDEESQGERGQLLHHDGVGWLWIMIDYYE